MSARLVGIVDYGIGNVASVQRSLRMLGLRSRLSHDPDVLDGCDVIILPGVGAFPGAMEALHRHGMTRYLQERAETGKPIVGICLGMQLLADRSSEIRPTPGLGLIPGYVEPLQDARWHIGWNTLEVLHDDSLLMPGDGRSLYFNHSYVMHTSPEYCIGVARLGEPFTPFTVAVRRGNLVGLQFHPEKSQAAGLHILSQVIEGLGHAG